MLSLSLCVCSVRVRVCCVIQVYSKELAAVKPPAPKPVEATEAAKEQGGEQDKAEAAKGSVASAKKTDVDAGVAVARGPASGLPSPPCTPN